ncbi:phosphohydrolase [Clostridia bacterium]|nr:phosphohydrolase [Clostridia bacterium]
MDSELRTKILACYTGGGERGEKRREHALAVEIEAGKLAERWGADAREARFAGLAHDCTKLWSAEEHLKFLEKRGILSEEPKLAHAVTGAEYAREEFGASEAAVSAIRWHTTGRADMTTLEKLIYLADKIDATRTYDGVERHRELAYSDLDSAMYAVMSHILIWNIKRDKIINETTLNARNYYLKVVKERE